MHGPGGRRFFDDPMMRGHMDITRRMWKEKPLVNPTSLPINQLLVLFSSSEDENQQEERLQDSQTL